jgi:hypothetical protein
MKVTEVLRSNFAVVVPKTVLPLGDNMKSTVSGTGLASSLCGWDEASLAPEVPLDQKVLLEVGLASSNAEM